MRLFKAFQSKYKHKNTCVGPRMHMHDDVIVGFRYLTRLPISPSLALTPHSNREHVDPPSVVSEK